MPFKDLERAREYSREYNRKYHKENGERINTSRRIARSKNWNQVIVKERKYRADNKTQMNARNHQYYMNNRDQISARSGKRYAENKEQHNAKTHERLAKLRTRFFDIYGSSCVCCGEKNQRLLTVGHKLNDGYKDKLEKGGYWGVIRRAIKHPNFTKYETQCFNCNCGAAHNDGLCPHKSDRKRIQAQLRSQFFEVYGGSCRCCGETTQGFLSVGHRLNDGKHDRFENGGSYRVMKYAVKHPDHARYETQCFNCNMGAKVNGGICPHKTKGAN